MKVKYHDNATINIMECINIISNIKFVTFNRLKSFLQHSRYYS